MKPNKSGIWEWFDEEGNKRLVEICDCSVAKNESWLRVYWRGGYYNIDGEEIEWLGKWGKRIGDNRSLPVNQLYLT